MKNKPFDNTVIIIGADHHNTLAAIRAFGQENCDIKAVILGHDMKRRKISVFMSKYINRRNSFIVAETEDAVKAFLNENASSASKPILFPASDFAEMVIDKNYAELEKNFILPGFEGKPGEVLRCMDKWEQYLFAREHDIPMAPTFLIELNNIVIPAELEFPCIVKPRISAYGSKSDIEICDDENALNTALAAFTEKGYKDALVQVFINKNAEACSLGCITKDGKILGGTVIKIREQLESATSYGKIVADNSEDTLNEYPELAATNKAVLEAIKSAEYVGQYDVDYLLCGDKTYLNEVNYRHSGNGYALVNDRINAPFAWALSCVGKEDKSRDGKVKIGSYMMAELYDKMYVKRKVLTLKEWINDIKRTDEFAVYNKKDKLMALRMYCRSAFHLVKRFVNSIKNRNRRA